MKLAFELSIELGEKIGKVSQGLEKIYYLILVWNELPAMITYQECLCSAKIELVTG